MTTIPRLVRTSELSESDRSFVAAFLAPRPWFDFYWQCALDDLARGLDNRSYVLGQGGDGLILAIHFDDSDIFTTIGDLEHSELAVLGSRAPRAEIHIEEAHADALTRLLLGRVRRKEQIRCYQLDDAPSAPADARCRPIAPGDHATVHALFQDHYPETVLSDYMLTLPMVGVWEEVELRAVAGTIVVNERIQACHLGNFLVDPAHRGRGLARVAADGLIALLRSRGVRRFMLGVHEHNEPAWRLYERLGFRLVASRPLLFIEPGRWAEACPPP